MATTEMNCLAVGGGGLTVDVYEKRASASDRYDVVFKPSTDTWMFCYENFSNNSNVIFYHDSTLGSNVRCVESYNGGRDITDTLANQSFVVSADGTITKNMNGLCVTFVAY